MTTDSITTRDAAGRLLLFCAWTAPACLTIFTADSLGGGAMRMLVVAGMAGVLAFLPGAIWKLALAVSTALIPYTLWWCGFAAASGGGPGYEAAMATLQTNPTEASGAVHTVLALPGFIFVAACHLACVALACVLALASTGAARMRWISPAFCLSLVPLTVSAVNETLHYSPAVEFPLIFGRAMLDSPLGSAEQIIEAHKRLGAIWERRYRRRTARAAKVVTAPVLAIFVIGESARSGSFGPDQSERGEASRSLQDRVAAGLGAWLPETCASSNGTYLSVPLLLTATPPERREDAPVVPTVLGILKASGFTTAWISNNEGGVDARERGHDFYGGPYSANPDGSAETLREPWKLDEEMLPLVERFAAPANGPRAMILHTMGSHLPYEQRYADADFQPAPPGLDREHLESIRYSNSLEHSAQFFLRLARVLDVTPAPAFLVYTSDHGENLRSDHNGLVYHLGPRTSTKDGTVPSFVLWNQAMGATGRPAQALTALLKADRIAHADVANLYLAMAGVEDGPVQPTAIPTTWAKVSVGDQYGAVPCSALKP